MAYLPLSLSLYGTILCWFYVDTLASIRLEAARILCRILTLPMRRPIKKSMRAR
jgi:hypothetical protein